MNDFILKPGKLYKVYHNIPRGIGYTDIQIGCYLYENEYIDKARYVFQEKEIILLISIKRKQMFGKMPFFLYKVLYKNTIGYLWNGINVIIFEPIK